MNRPEVKNALNPEMLCRMADAWDLIDSDSDIRVAILTGADGAFCAGADLDQLVSRSIKGLPPENEFEERIRQDYNVIFKGLLRNYQLKKPLIAAIEGACIAGGTEVLQATDIRVAGESATFGISEVRLGLFPMGGSTVRLRRQIPYTNAMEILLTGDHFPATEALRIGLIGRVVGTSVRTMLQRLEPRRAEFRELARREKRFPEELWQGFADVGLLGCLVPEEYGGNGAGLLALTIGFEEVCANGFSPGLLLVTAMDSACILKNGSDQIKQRFLPGIADGSLKLCFAITEPDAGTNTFRITTHARRDGDNYVLNGQKMFISGADIADYMLVVARTTTLDELEAVKLMTYRAAWAFDNDLNPAEVGTYANMAKFLGADLAIKAVDAAIETHGGLGFAEETGLITQWVGARLLKTAPVSREMILNYVSEWNLGLPRSY